MSDFFSALQAEDQKADHGWSHANLFSQVNNSGGGTSMTENQMFTQNTPESQSIGSLEGWTDSSVVQEEIVQDIDTGQYTDGNFTPGSQEALQQIISTEFIDPTNPPSTPGSQIFNSQSSDSSSFEHDPQGEFRTINVMVSSDGTLVDAATGSSVTTLFDPNNTQNVQDTPNADFIGGDPSVTGNGMSCVSNASLCSGPSSVLSQGTTLSYEHDNRLNNSIASNSVNVVNSTQSNKKLIYLPNLEKGQLDNQTVQQLLKKYSALSPRKTVVQASPGKSSVPIQPHVTNEQVLQSSVPKLTSLLTSDPNAQGVVQSPLQGNSQMSVAASPQKSAVSLISGQGQQVPIAQVQQVATLQKQNVGTVQFQQQISNVRQGKIIGRPNQTVQNTGQTTIVVVQPPARQGNPVTFNNNAISKSLKVIQPGKQIVGNRVVTYPNNVNQSNTTSNIGIMNGRQIIVNPKNNSSAITGQNFVITSSSSQNAVGGGQKIFLTSEQSVSKPVHSHNTAYTRYVSAQEGTAIDGRNLIVSGASASDIFAAINSNKGINNPSTSQNASYVITQSGNTVISAKPVRGRGSRGSVTVGRGRGRGRGQSKLILQQGNLVIPSISTLNNQPQATTQVVDLITSPIKSVSQNQASDPSIGDQNKAPGAIDKKFVQIKDGEGDFIVGHTYLVSGPGGLQKKMKFTGNTFVDIPASEQVLNDSGMTGGGKKLKGNATGLNMLKESYSESDTKSRGILPNGRAWKFADPPSGGNLTRKPLHQHKDSETESSQDSSSQVSDSGTEKDKGPPDQFSKDQYKPCKFCGMSSSNLTRCERCGRIFPVTVKAQSVSSSTIIDKNKFYSTKLNEQAAVYSGYPVKHSDASTGKSDRIPPARTLRLVNVRKRNIPQEPVTVTISSDEDEPQENNKEKSQNSKQEVKNSEPDELSQLVSVIPIKRSSSPTFTKGSRISRMEDKEGQPMRKVRRKNSGDSLGSIRTVSTKTVVINKQGEESTEEASNVMIECRSIRVGSLKGTPVDPVFISKEYIEFNMEGEDDSHSLKIESCDVLKCLVGRKNNVIFLHLNSEAGEKIRTSLNMKEEIEGKPYFDPSGKDDRHKFVTFFLANSCKINLSALMTVFESYKHYKIEEFLIDLTEEDQRKLLVKTAPIYGQHFQEVLEEKIQKGSEAASGEGSNSRAATPAENGEPTEMERSPSPPKFMFSGPIEKLITYPPKPATGGICVTNEDLFCLSDGEFLNDVIIDFYLKYLVNEKLSEYDRKRTHVFSSFFFKRLTQRINKSTDVLDTDLSLAERRHARVKKWTKHVDLFEKDFIIVPINERSHWFLAIICFPGYTQSKQVHYMQKEVPVIPETTTNEKGDSSENCSQESQEKEEDPPLVENNGETKEQPNDGETKDQPNNGETKEQPNNGETKDQPMKESVKTESHVENEEQDLDKEEAMDTTETGSTCGSETLSPLEQPKGRFLTEEEMKNPEISQKAKVGQLQPCIMVMDSLAGQSRGRIITCLKEYLQVEWNCKKCKTGSIKERFKGANLKVPQQTNYSDCGVYVLQYVESFFEDPILDFTFPMKGLTTWFTEERVTRKRKEIADLVMQLKEKYDIANQQSS